jgi:hypothetical protein
MDEVVALSAAFPTVIPAKAGIHFALPRQKANGSQLSLG